jgi:hypothetical protein
MMDQHPASYEVASRAVAVLRVCVKGPEDGCFAFVLPPATADAIREDFWLHGDAQGVRTLLRTLRRYMLASSDELGVLCAAIVTVLASVVRIAGEGPRAHDAAVAMRSFPSARALLDSAVQAVVNHGANRSQLCDAACILFQSYGPFELEEADAGEEHAAALAQAVAEHLGVGVDELDDAALERVRPTMETFRRDTRAAKLGRGPHDFVMPVPLACELAVAMLRHLARLPPGLPYDSASTTETVLMWTAVARCAVGQFAAACALHRHAGADLADATDDGGEEAPSLQQCTRLVALSLEQCRRTSKRAEPAQTCMELLEWIGVAPGEFVPDGYGPGAGRSVGKAAGSLAHAGTGDEGVDAITKALAAAVIVKPRKSKKGKAKAAGRP